MKEGDTKTLRFFGDFENEEAPVSFGRHYIKRLDRGQQYQVCTNGEDGGECVFCYAKNKGDKGVGYGSVTVGFFVKDYILSHVLDSEVRILKPGVNIRPGQKAKPDDYITTRYPPCGAPKRPCAYCNQGNNPREGGYLPFELSGGYADLLMALQPRLRAFCKSCLGCEGGEGTIQVTGYTCSHPQCGLEVSYYPEDGNPTAHCPNCGNVGVPNESIWCPCENPVRCDIQDFLINVTRTGAEKDTNYSFVPSVPPSPPTDEELELGAKYAPNWDDRYRGLQPAEQASLLGIPNPFGRAVPTAQSRQQPAPRAVSFSQAGAMTGRLPPVAAPAAPTVPARKPPPAIGAPRQAPVPAANDDDVPFLPITECD